MDIGKVLKKTMAKNGWSMHEMGRRAGVSHSTIHRLMNGYVSPNMRTICKIAKGLGLPPQSVGLDKDIFEEI